MLTLDFLFAHTFTGATDRFVSKPGTDCDLLQQLQIYEAQLKQEDDGETPSGSISNQLR
jgi:hypothetical protein